MNRNELAREVRRTLVAAGYQVVDDGRHPGLSVTEVPEGARVRWLNSDVFASTAEHHPSRENLLTMHRVAQAAVKDLLIQPGHIVSASQEGGDVLVLLAGETQNHRAAG